MRTLLIALTFVHAMAVPCFAESYHCGFCHNPDFSGRDNVPRLAAQREDYLAKALREYKSNARPGYDASMAEVTQPISDAEILDLAYFMARAR
jgi:cytochrome c553